ncbi:MAG TPA: hypothetical protein DDW52_05265 [Planctomycetaceae bacterium]|nr:hypothetical protein [Planctomycetaceae bacterium]
MSITQEKIEQFREFAMERLATDATSLNMVDLAAEWEFEHESQEHQQHDVAAVNASLRDMDAGQTGRPMSEFLAEFRQRNQSQTEQ